MTAPAQVSGPGEFSKRTDAGGQPIRDLPDPSYGEATAFRDAQKGAPLAGSQMDAVPPPPSPSTMGPSGPPVGPSQPLPDIFGGTSRPDEPVTAGAPVGPGSNVIPGQDPGQFDPQTLRAALEPYFAADTSGVLANTAHYLAERGWM